MHEYKATPSFSLGHLEKKISENFQNVPETLNV
jgi:hypothetical protein